MQSVYSTALANWANCLVMCYMHYKLTYQNIAKILTLTSNYSTAPQNFQNIDELVRMPKIKVNYILILIFILKILNQLKFISFFDKITTLNRVASGLLINSPENGIDESSSNSGWERHEPISPYKVNNRADLVLLEKKILNAKSKKRQ